MSRLIEIKERYQDGIREDLVSIVQARAELWMQREDILWLLEKIEQLQSVINSTKVAE